MTLTKTEIRSRLFTDDEKLEALVVTPILDLEDQLGACSFDVRLGKQFIVFKEHFKECFSLKKLSNDIRSLISVYQEEIVIPIGRNLILHPGKLVIGSTFEYISIPRDLECQVEGRSSWARLGLVIAAATTVEPCFKGVITLELCNHGTIPIELYPGLKIAQLIFHKNKVSYNMSEEEIKRRKYHHSIGPGKSRIYHDKYLKYFVQSEKSNNQKL